MPPVAGPVPDSDPEAARVVVRPIEPGDARGLERFYAGLSDESRTLRFMGWTRGIGEAGSRAFCTADHEHREGFVAVLARGAGEPAAGEPEIVGHLCVEPDGRGSAEIAVAVADRLQGRGIGRRLVDAGVAWGRHAGLRRFTATAFAWNTPILRLLRGLGLPVCLAWADGTCELRIELSEGLPVAA